MHINITDLAWYFSHSLSKSIISNINNYRRTYPILHGLPQRPPPHLCLSPTGILNLSYNVYLALAWIMIICARFNLLRDYEKDSFCIWCLLVPHVTPSSVFHTEDYILQFRKNQNFGHGIAFHLSISCLFKPSVSYSLKIISLAH